MEITGCLKKVHNFAETLSTYKSRYIKEICLVW